MLDAAQSFKAQRAQVEAGELDLRERPAAAGDVRARLKVLLLQLQDLAAPLRGTAAVGAEAAFVNAAMRLADDLAAVQGLRARLQLQTAAFKQRGVQTTLRQLRCQQNPRRSGADDADVDVRRKRGLRVIEVMQHALIGADGSRLGNARAAILVVTL